MDGKIPFSLTDAILAKVKRWQVQNSDYNEDTRQSFKEPN